MGLIQPLFEGPLDIVGDVHGELDALRDLLRHLGYGADGSHPAECGWGHGGRSVAVVTFTAAGGECQRYRRGKRGLHHLCFLEMEQFGPLDENTSAINSQCIYLIKN